MKPLIEISTEHYEALLRYTSEMSPLHWRLKNAVKTETNTISILCEPDEAEMLRHLEKSLCPGAIPHTEKAIRTVRVSPYLKPTILLRDHPLISYKGNCSWPPRWVRRVGNDTSNPRGEVGILKDVVPSLITPYDRCFLIMEHRGAEYLGALLLSDTAFCREIFGVLLQNRGKTMQEIGSIDLAHTL